MTEVGASHCRESEFDPTVSTVSGIQINPEITCCYNIQGHKIRFATESLGADVLEPDIELSFRSWKPTYSPQMTCYSRFICHSGCQER